MSKEEEQGMDDPSAWTCQTGQAGQGPVSGAATGTATGSMSGAMPGTAAGMTTLAVAWYARPLFWSGFLLAGILALFGWLAWQAWQTAEAKRLALEKELAEAREANQAREDFIQRLKLLLQAEPCDLPAELGKLTPPAGIIWPPLGSGKLPDHPESLPDKSASPDRPARGALI